MATKKRIGHNGRDSSAAFAHTSGIKHDEKVHDSSLSPALPPKGKRARTSDADNENEPPTKKQLVERDQQKDKQPSPAATNNTKHREGQAPPKVPKITKGKKKIIPPGGSSAIGKPPTTDIKETVYESESLNKPNTSTVRRSYRSSRIVTDSDDDLPMSAQVGRLSARSARLKRQRVIESDDEESDDNAVGAAKEVARETAPPPKKAVKLSPFQMIAMTRPWEQIKKNNVTASMLEGIKVQKRKPVDKCTPTTTPFQLQSLSPNRATSFCRPEGKTTWMGRGQSWKPLRGPDARHNVLSGANQTHTISPNKPSSERAQDTRSQMPDPKLDANHLHSDDMGANATGRGPASNKRKAEGSPLTFGPNKRQRRYEDTLLDSYVPLKDDTPLAIQKRNSLKRKAERKAAQEAYRRSQSAPARKRSQAAATKAEAKKAEAKKAEAKKTVMKKTDEAKKTDKERTETELRKRADIKGKEMVTKELEAKQTDWAKNIEAMKIELAKLTEAKKTEAKETDDEAERETESSIQSKAREKGQSRPTETVKAVEKGPSANEHHQKIPKSHAASPEPNALKGEVERKPSKSTGEGMTPGHTASINRPRRDTFDSGYVSKSTTHSPPDIAPPPSLSSSIKYPVVPAFGFYLPLPQAAQTASGSKSEVDKQAHAKGTGNEQSKLHITSTHEEDTKGEK